MAPEEAGTSLYDTGWRQGSVFTADLSPVSFVLNVNTAATATFAHSVWVVAAQDCDLSSAHIASNQPSVEVRPVHRGGPSTAKGIRSRRLRLRGSDVLDASDPRPLMSPALLAGLAATREPDLTDDEAKAFKRWLGLRYDRPAVPDDCVSLARAIANAVQGAAVPDLTDHCHDVLMQFGPGAPVKFALWCVIDPEHPHEPFAEWLTGAAASVPPELGVLAFPPRVVTKDRLTLDVLENSYPADLSDITWRGEPRGAR